MKKRIAIPLIAVLSLAAVLFCVLWQGALRDRSKLKTLAQAGAAEAAQRFSDYRESVEDADYWGGVAAFHVFQEAYAGSIGLQRGIWQPSAAPGAGKRASSGADRGNGTSLPKRRGQSGAGKALGTPQCVEVRIINGKRPFASKTRCGGSLFRSFSGNVQTTVTEGFYNKEKPEKEEVQ